MRNLLYPLLALVGSVVGSVILWLRTRKPTSFESSIEDFHRGLKALEPEERTEDASRRSDSPGLGRTP